MEKEILANQVITDLSELLKDIESGMNEEDIKKEWNRIYPKSTEYLEMVRKEIKEAESKIAQIMRLMEAIEETYRLRELLKTNVEIGIPKEE